MGPPVIDTIEPVRSLFDGHYTPMVRTATALLGSRALAEEAVQEAFVRMSRAVDRVPADKHVAYLRQIVVNEARATLRRDKAQKRQARPILSVVGSPEDAAVASDDERRMLALLDELPDRQRQCLVLRYYDGLTDTEIADAVGISLGSTKTHIRRGLEALRTKAVAR